MSKQNNKLKLKISTSQGADRKSLFHGGITVIIIALSPFVFYAYDSFPASQVWETPFGLLETGFKSWVVFAWYLLGKIVPLGLLLLWFFTCRHWWHWIILVPIAMYAFQIWAVLRESRGAVDELELVYIVPLLFVLVPFVYLIRAKLFNKMRGSDLQSFEEELRKETGLWGQLKDLFR